MIKKSDRKIIDEIRALVGESDKDKDASKDCKIKDLEHTIEYFVTLVVGNIIDSRRFVENAKANGLTLNQLEAEGGLRTCLSLLDRLKEWDTETANVVDRILKREEE